MKWEKKGWVYAPDGSSSWARHSALTPTPLLVDPNTIRVYAGFRDDGGVSRIGFVDVAADDPTRILEVSETPALDIGAPGTFDDNGVILGDVLVHQDKVLMYYVGFETPGKVKFRAFSGLAVSSDGGRTFTRSSEAPLLDRADGQRYIRAIHSVRVESGVWRAWYSAGDGWEWIDGKPYPRYDIRYLESADGVAFRGRGVPCVGVEGREYRIGRPRVYELGEGYVMFYTRGTLDGDYVPGCAASRDGIVWTRRDADVGIDRSSSGWDSRSLAYPALLRWRDAVYMFYNGNDMGRSGFGYAELSAADRAAFENSA